MTTSPGPDYVTKADFDRAMERIDAKFELLEARLEIRIERATVTNIRWTVGIALSQYALFFGLILFFISREIPHA
jgi:hypothetical protein